MAEFTSKYRMLVEYMEKLDRVVVAFSGGVDSSLLLWAAMDSLGREKVLAVTARSVIHPPEEVEEARRLAAGIGARWQSVEATEMKNEEFLANSPERCYYCKSGLMALLAAVASGEGGARVVEGSNLSDMHDFRPGFRAVRETGALSPLVEAGLTKEEIREAARERGIPSWDRPSDACLCSRLPYGVRITREGLNRIYLAEHAVRELGVSVIRVRDHGDIARLEVSGADIEKVCSGERRVLITRKLRELGYKYVAVDLEGYRTGKMND
ncbi:MAG: ATP-dependent sacrificial sulfur transferase LarE [Desulfocucumaceae bacterium]